MSLICVSPREENCIPWKHVTGDPKLAKEAQISLREQHYAELEGMRGILTPGMISRQREVHMTLHG